MAVAIALVFITAIFGAALGEEESGGAEKWKRIDLHDTGIDEIDWHDHLKFYWNTPILTASSDPEIHPFLQHNIFHALNEILQVLPLTVNRFGDIFNVTDVLTLFDELIADEAINKTSKKVFSSFGKLMDIYKKRIVSWMGLYTRGQCQIHSDLNSLYLYVLSPGDVIPLHATFNFPVNNMFHEDHDLISVLSIQPESFYAKNEADDGIFIYDPRGTASGYGFANVFIHTSQSEQLNTRGGYIHIFPSGVKFNALPVDYTRVFLVSFAKIYSIHQPYRKKKKNSNFEGIETYHLQEGKTKYMVKNDKPFFDQNIQFFSSFGTPFFTSSIAKYKSLSVPAIDINMNTFEILSECFIDYKQHTQSVRKSNRNGWQSKANMFDTYKGIKWKKDECKQQMIIVYDYVIEQISLWLLSFSNSYYFDDNGLVISFQTMNDNKVFVDVVHSWININTAFAMNVPHSHPNSDLSGVIYIEVPPKSDEDSFDGDVFFDDPRSNLFDNNMRLQFAQFNEPLQVTPKTGDVILFPSWLRHWTMPSYYIKPRISLAFNVKFKDKQSMTKEERDVGAENSDTIQILKKEL